MCFLFGISQILSVLKEWWRAQCKPLGKEIRRWEIYTLAHLQRQKRKEREILHTYPAEIHFHIEIASHGAPVWSCRDAVPLVYVHFHRARQLVANGGSFKSTYWKKGRVSRWEDWDKGRELKRIDWKNNFLLRKAYEISRRKRRLPESNIDLARMMEEMAISQAFNSRECSYNLCMPFHL